MRLSVQPVDAVGVVLVPSGEVGCGDSGGWDGVAGGGQSGLVGVSVGLRVREGSRDGGWYKGQGRLSVDAPLWYSCGGRLLP